MQTILYGGTIKRWVMVLCFAIMGFIAILWSNSLTAWAEPITEPQQKCQKVKTCLPLAQQGDRDAQILVASGYYIGFYILGVRKDLEKSAYWYEQASRQGSGLAQAVLAQLYYEGKGVVQDIVKSHMYASLAVQNGFTYSPDEADKFQTKKSIEAVQEAQNIADTLGKELTWEQKTQSKNAQESYRANYPNALSAKPKMPKN